MKVLVGQLGAGTGHPISHQRKAVSPRLHFLSTLCPADPHLSLARLLALSPT